MRSKSWLYAIMVCGVGGLTMTYPVCSRAQLGPPTSSGWAFKCPDGSLPDAGGSCNRGSSSSSSGGSADREAAAREARDRAANEAYWLRRNAQIDSARNDSIKRANERVARQRMNAEQRRRQFEIDKARGISELRTDLKNSDLKDAVVSSDLAISDNSANRSSSSPQVRKAYGQAYCGLTLLSKAIKELGAGGGGDASESRFLANQAAIVFDGEKPEVACPPTPDVQLSANVNMTKVIARERAVLQKVEGLIDHSASTPRTGLSPDDERIQEIYRKQKANEGRLTDDAAGVIAVQRKINEAQERKYDPKDGLQIKREQQVRDKLKEVVENATENMRKGDVEKAVTDLSVNLDNILSKPSTSKSNSTRKAK